MKTLLSLDISSSTIGYAIFEYDQHVTTLKFYGHIKPPSKKKAKGSLSYRLDKTLLLIDNLLLKYQPDEICVEDYAKRFSAGRSRAHTIILLSCFNELISLKCYQYSGQETFRYPVVTIRSQVGKLFKLKTVSKDEIFDLIIANCKIYQKSFNKKNTLLKECFDEVDAVAVGITHILKTNKSTQIWNI